MNERAEAIARGAMKRLSELSGEAGGGGQEGQSRPDWRAGISGDLRPAPETQVLESMLGRGDEASGRCFVEPGKPCVGCSGRCRTLGF